MNSFVESICKIGIFIIAAQAVIHFAPAAKYEKYMRLVVGIIVLMQFLVPINKITDGIDGSWEAEADWGEKLADMEKELERGLAVEGGEEGSQFGENFVSGIEVEIKSRLNSALDNENYSILKVNVEMDSSGGESGQYNMPYDDINNDGYTNYQLNAIQVYVMVQDDSDNSGVVKVEKVHINKIGADEDDVNMDDAGQTTSNEKQEDNKQKVDKQEVNRQKESARLREKFAAVLGVGEEYMEVSIYGWTE